MPEIAVFFVPYSVAFEFERQLGCRSMNINALNSVYGVGNLPTAKPAGETAASGFGDAMKRALEGVSASQNHADAMQREFQMENSKVSLEETMVAMTKANIEFQALLQVRNKVISAYNEIMNM